MSGRGAGRRDPPHHLDAAAAGQVYVEQHDVGVVRRSPRRSPRRRRRPRPGRRRRRGRRSRARRGRPRRNIAWSSTITIPTGPVRSLLSHRSPPVGRRAGAAAPRCPRRAPTGPRPSRRAAASGRRCCCGRRTGPRGTASGSKPAAAVADEHVDRAVGDLGVHVHLAGAGVLGGVGDRLAGRVHDRAQRLVEVAVADVDDLDGHAVLVLDRGPRRRAARWRRCARRWTRRRTARTAGRAPGRGPGGRRSAASSAFFWISARVCSTESCRCAATSARSWVRTRSARSSVRSEASR